MIKIIAVDDEPAFGEMLSIYMEEFGNFQITVYTSPEDAIDKIVAGEADAVITDYLMEEMDGISFIRKVKSLVPDIPFVFLTALDDKDVILNATNAGADFIQFKSEEPSRLFPDIAQKITNSVEKYRARRESERGSRTREMLMRTQRDLMARLSESSTTNQALDATLTTVRFLAGCNSGAIHLMNQKTNKIELAISHNLPNDLIRRFTFGDLYKVFYEKKARYYQDPGKPETTGHYSGGQIPIMAGTDVIGILSFILDHTKPLSPELTDTMELITGHLGNTLVRIRSEELVRQRENELSELYKVMQELVIVIDMDGTILNVNPATTRILRYSEEELIGMPIQVLYPPKIRDEIIFQFMDLTGSGETIQNTYPLIDRQGLEVPVETRGSIGTWGDRHVLFCISRDIRERLEAERNLHEYYERISAILASSTAQIYMKNNELRYLPEMSHFSHLYIVMPGNLWGKPITTSFPRRLQRFGRRLIRKSLQRMFPSTTLRKMCMAKMGAHIGFSRQKFRSMI
jgi:PAS domain S-box-containing protein